jgi:hypothetical protein
MIKALLNVLTAPYRAIKEFIESIAEERRRRDALVRIVDLLKAEDESIRNTWKAMAEVMASAMEDKETH